MSVSKSIVRKIYIKDRTAEQGGGPDNSDPIWITIEGANDGVLDASAIARHLAVTVEAFVGPGRIEICFQEIEKTVTTEQTVRTNVKRSAAFRGWDGGTLAEQLDTQSNA